MSKKIIIFYKIISFSIFFGLIMANCSIAKAAIVSDLSGSCLSSGNCELNDFMRIAINVSKWILGITGSLSLLAFIYGGVMFLISAGSSERVNQAKSIIFGAVIGLVIVFASYTIIGFIFKALGVSGSWFQVGGISL